MSSCYIRNCTYNIFINIIIILRDLWRAKKAKEAWTILSFCDGFGILGSLFWFLLQDLMRQAFPRIPFNLRPMEYPNIRRDSKKKETKNFSRTIEMKLPNCFLQYRIIFINHVICFCKDRILEKRISIKEEFQLKTLWVINSTPFDIFEELKSLFITLRDLIQGNSIS